MRPCRLNGHKQSSPLLRDGGIKNIESGTGQALSLRKLFGLNMFLNLNVKNKSKGAQEHHVEASAIGCPYT